MAEYKISHFTELKNTMTLIQLKSLWGKRLRAFRARKKIVLHIFPQKQISKFPENLSVALKQLSELVFIGLSFRKTFINIDVLQLLIQVKFLLNNKFS
jgi:hypothetical protein